MSRTVSDLTCNETMSDDAERGIVSGSNSLSRRYQLAPTQSPASFRVAQPVSRYTATSVGKPGSRGGYTVASTNRTIPSSAHTVPRTYTVAPQASHLSQINATINNVQLSTTQAQQATANRIMRTHPVPDPGDYGLYPNVVMTHNQIVRPSGSSREIVHPERVVSSRAAYRVERPPSIREERVFRQEPTIMREIIREEIPQPQIVHRAHGVVTQAHVHQQHQPQMNLYINSMRLTQPPAPQATAKIGVGALHSVQQMAKNSDRSNSYSPSVRAYSTTPSGLQRTVTPTTSHQNSNPSRFTPVNGTSVQSSIVRPVPTQPATRIVTPHIANHGLLQPPINPMTHAIPDSPTPVQQFMNLQRTTTTQSPRPSILRTPGSAAKRKLALAGLENTSCTNGNNSALCSAVRSLSATSITNVTKGTMLPSGDVSTTPEPSPRKRQRKQQLEPTPSLLETIKHQQFLAAQAKAQLEAAQRQAEADQQTKEAWMAKAMASKHEEPAKKKRGRPKSDGLARPTTAGPLGKTPNKPRGVRTAVEGDARSMATQRFLADQEAKYRASQASADDSFEYKTDSQEYVFTGDASTSMGNLSYELSNEPQPKSMIAQRHLAQQRAAAVQQYAAQVKHTQKPINATAGGIQRPPQTATAPALQPATPHVKKQKGPRIKHSLNPSTSKQQTNPKEETEHLRSKRISARRNLNVEKDADGSKHSSPVKPGSDAANAAKLRKPGANPVEDKILGYLAEAIQARLKRRLNENGEVCTDKKTPTRTKAQITALREAILKAAEAAKLPPRESNLKLGKAKSMDTLVATRSSSTGRPSRKPSAPQRGSTPSAGPIRRSISVPDGNIGKELESNDQKKKDTSTEEAKQSGKKVKISRIVLKKRVKMKKKKDDDPTKEFRGEITKPSKMRVHLPVISLNPKANHKEAIKKTENAKKKQVLGKKKSSKKYEKELNCDGMYPMQTRWASIFLAALMRKRQQKIQVEGKLNKLKKKRQINTSIPMSFRKLEVTTTPKSRGISIMAGLKPEESRPNHFEQPKYVHKALTLRQEMISNLRKQQRLDRADNLIAKRTAKTLLHENEMSISHLCSSFETNADGSLTDIDQELLVESLKNVLQTRDSKTVNATQKAKETSKKQIWHLRKLKARVLGLRKRGVNIYTKKDLRKAKEQIVQTLPSTSCSIGPPSEETTLFDEHFASVSEDKQLPTELTAPLENNTPVTVSKGKHREALMCVSTSVAASSITCTSTSQEDSKESVKPHLQQYFVVHRFDKERNLKSLLNKLTAESDEKLKEELRLQIRQEIRIAQEEKQKTQLEQITLEAVRKLRMESFDEQMKKLLQTSVKSHTSISGSTHTKKMKAKYDLRTTSPKKTTPTLAVGSIVEKNVVRLNKDDLPVILTKRFFLEKHPPTRLDSKSVNCQLEMKKRKQILRYKSNSSGVPVPRVSKVVNFRLPFPIEDDFSRPTEEQLKEELESNLDTASISGEVITLIEKKLEENQSINPEDCKFEEIKEELLEEVSLAGRSATFAGSSSSSELMQPIKPIQKDKHLLILEAAMRNISKKGEKKKPTTGQPSTFCIPMLKCAPSPTTSKPQSRIKSKPEKPAKDEQRPRSKSESDQNSKRNKEKIRTEKDKKKEDARKTDLVEENIQEPKESSTATSSEDSTFLCEKSDDSSSKATDVTEIESVEGPVAAELSKITKVYDSADLRKIDKSRVISQRITEKDGKLVKVIRMRKDPVTAPKTLLQLTENQVKVIKQCKKLPVRQFLQPIVAPLDVEDFNEVTDLVDDMVHYTAMMNNSEEAEFESESLLAKAFIHPMNAVAPTFRSVIDVMQPVEAESVQLTDNQFAVGTDMQNEMWWKIAAKKDVTTEDETIKEAYNESEIKNHAIQNDYSTNNHYAVTNTTVLKPSQRKTIKLVRPNKISRAVALLQQYSSRVEDQMTLETTTLLAFETFLEQYDPKAYHELQLNVLRDYEEGDTVDIVEEKKMLRLRHTILLPPIEFLPNKKPDYGDICQSVVMNPSEEFQNQVMKGCSTFWRGKLNGNPKAMHLNRYGHQIVDRCEGFIPLQTDHKEFYLEDVQDYADATKFEKYYAMFEETTEVTNDSRLNYNYDGLNENKKNLTHSTYNGVSRRAVLKQGATEILFMGEKPVNGMICSIAPYKLEMIEMNAKQQNRVRSIREIFATSFKAMHETTQIMMQTRELMVQSLALRSSREAFRRLQLAKQRVRQTRVKTKTPKPNVVTLLKKLRRRLHRQKSLALRELSNPEKSPNSKEKAIPNALKTKFSMLKQTPKKFVKLGSMPPFKPLTMSTTTPAAAVKRKLIPVYGSPTKKIAVEDNGKPAAKVITVVEKPIVPQIVIDVIDVPKMIEPVTHRGTVNRGGRPPLRKHGLGRGGSVGDRKPVPEEVKQQPVPVVRGGVMGRGLGRSGPITRVAKGSGLSRGAHRSISSSTSSSNNDIVGTPAPVEIVEKVTVVRKPHKPRVPKTPTIASDSTFERQMRRAIQESLRDVPSSSKTAAGK